MNELDRYAVSLENMEVLRAQVEALEAWKAEELLLMNPLMDYARSVCTGPLGCSITGWLVEDHKRLAALSTNHGEQVRDGWQLVPVEPTREMISAASGAITTPDYLPPVGAGRWSMSDIAFRSRYRAAIAAAPSQASQKEQGE